MPPIHKSWGRSFADHWSSIRRPIGKVPTKISNVSSQIIKHQPDTQRGRAPTFAINPDFATASRIGSREPAPSPTPKKPLPHGHVCREAISCSSHTRMSASRTMAIDPISRPGFTALVDRVVAVRGSILRLSPLPPRPPRPPRPRRPSPYIVSLSAENACAARRAKRRLPARDARRHARSSFAARGSHLALAPASRFPPRLVRAKRAPLPPPPPTAPPPLPPPRCRALALARALDDDAHRHVGKRNIASVFDRFVNFRKFHAPFTR